MSYYDSWRDPMFRSPRSAAQAEREVAKLGRRRHSQSPGDDRGAEDRQDVLGQGLVRQSRTLQRLCQPPAARPHLCPQRFRRRPADRQGRDHGTGHRLRALQGRDHHRPGRRPRWKAICRDCSGRSIRWSSSSRAASPRASWTACAGRAMACSRPRTRSRCPAAARTGQACASTSRPRSTASAPGSTSSRSFFSCCAASTRAS